MKASDEYDYLRDCIQFGISKKNSTKLITKEFYVMLKKLLIGIIIFSFMVNCVQAQSKYGWYTEGKDYNPAQRIRITVTNPLTIPLKDCPVVIRRSQLPVQNIPERWIALIDPNLPSHQEPTFEELKVKSGYLRRKETNGHYLVLQIDDVDKNGIWDEMFFLTDLVPRETREFYIYIGQYERGTSKQFVHGAIASYGRHLVPFMESEDMGWKLWYPHDLDLHGKRVPMLISYYEYSTATSGYFLPAELGADIMTVAKTFGAGGMCLFERPNDPESLVRAFYSPTKDKGPFNDTRFAYDVVYNGPLRSMVKVTTTNWNSGQGFYELEQYYSVIAHKSWCKVEVKFNKFFSPGYDVMFGAGIRRIMQEYKSIHKGGIAISMGKDIDARIPDEDIGGDALKVPWEGIGLVVKDEFKPEYLTINNYGGNHLFKMAVTPNLAYEYMVFGGWSFGEVNNNEKDFVRYVDTEALKYNNPAIVQIQEHEVKR